MNNFVILTSIAVILMCILQKSQVNAECCPPDNDKCLDGTDTPEFQCCAHGKCNIFCCACADGCRVAKTKRDVSVHHGHSILQKYDVDNDGCFDKKEAHNYWQSGACGRGHGNTTLGLEQLEKEFINFDKNHDGKLSFEEIDEL